MREQNQHLEALQDIRQLMQRSSRFISLSGLSGIAAGIWALIGAYFAHNQIADHYHNYSAAELNKGFFYEKLVLDLLLLAGAILGLALLSAFYFTWRKTQADKVPLWNHTSRQLTINMLIPLAAGGIFVLTMLQRGDWHFVASACLIFYGLALVNASKYTLSDIRYLGICEIVLGLAAARFIGYGLHFWAVGFGVLHIVYGFIMWNKYERKAAMR
jgi:general stress protein CsbA